jgi:predicted N-acyltransferase
VIELSIHASIREIPEADWDHLVGPDGAPFLRWAWLDALERAGCVGRGTGWMPHHIAMREGGALVAAAPAYIKGNSEGEFVFDYAWANLAHRLGLEYYPKLICAVPFTPATATRLITPASSRERLLPALAEGLRRLVEAHGISSAHVLFLPEDEARALSAAGMAHRHGVQFHWQNRGYRTFDDFLAGFSSKRRHQIKRERRELDKQGVTITTARGKDLTAEVVAAMYRFYTSTVDKFTWGRRYLNRAFFDDVCARMSGQVEIVLARDAQGKPIAGAFNLAGGGALYGRYWGATEERPFLHFNVCYYHSIEECIARGVQRFEPGAGGEHKVARGFDPTITHSVHHLADRRFDEVVRAHLERERHAIREHVARGTEE